MLFLHFVLSIYAGQTGVISLPEDGSKARWIVSTTLPLSTNSIVGLAVYRNPKEVGFVPQEPYKESVILYVFPVTCS